MKYSGCMAAFFCACCLLFSPALHSQEFSSISGDLDQLESLIAGTLQDMEEQRQLLENLQQSLLESGDLIESYESATIRQGQLLEDLQNQLNEMLETYRMQSALSEKYAKSSKFWKTFTLIAVPAAAALSGGLAWMAAR